MPVSFETDFFDAKEQIRQAIGIVDLVRSYIELRPSGRIYVGHCPWHNDSRPSLQVNPERQTWRCWVCDIGGDLFSFVMQREQVDFREALEILADRAGVVLRRHDPRGKVEPGGPRHKPTLYRTLAWAEQQFHECLLHASESTVARDYLRERGISQESIERFHLGFSPSGWQWLLDRARGTSYSPELLEAVGLVAKSPKSDRFYDRFRERLIFPIRDTMHRCVAFGGRVLPQFAENQPAKYINSPETRLFTKSEMLYGLDLARDQVGPERELVIVEGYTDVVMAHQVGVRNVAAVLGTALNERHIANLRRFADRVALVLDGDEAGRNKANVVLELFVAADLDLRILTLPDNQDPFDYFSQFGADAFREHLRLAVDALQHKIDVATRDVDLLNDTHRASEALEEVLGTLAKSVRSETSVLREEQMLARLARRFAIEESQLRQRLQQLRRQQAARPAAGFTGNSAIAATGGEARGPRSTDRGGPAPRTAEGNSGAAGEPSMRPGRPGEKLSPQEQELLGILTHHPELVGEAVRQIEPQQLTSTTAQELLIMYAQRFESGASVEFEAILSDVEDLGTKNLLVRADEEAQRRTHEALEAGPERLAGLVRHFELISEAGRRRETEYALQNGNLDEQEELQALLQIYQSERNRQGISAPTEG
jgi:DNA primase